MSQMTQREFENWKSQFVISNKEKMSLRKLPLIFTEQGVAMQGHGDIKKERQFQG